MMKEDGDIYLFLLYVNDIGKDITSNIWLFADDCILYTCINDSNDSEALQSDLQRLVDWSASCQMNFNTQNCSVMHVTIKKTVHHYQYMINEENLGLYTTHTWVWSCL